MSRQRLLFIYISMNKKLLATGGLVSSLLLLSTTAAAYAATSTAPSRQAPTNTSRMRHMRNDGAFVTTMATKLGLDAATVKAELDSGKTIRDILADNNITEEKMKAAFGGRGHGGRGHGMMHDNSKLTEIATKLGLDAAAVKEQLDSGKSFKDILTENNITHEQIKTVLGSQFEAGKGPHGQHGPRQMPSEVLALQAKVLGVTVEQLQAEFADGQRITDVLKNHNMTIEEFDTQIKAAAQAALTAGNLTDEQMAHYQRIVGRASRISK